MFDNTENGWTEDVVSRFRSKLKLPYSVEKTVKQIVKKAAEFISERSPVSLAAAAIYMTSQVSGYKKTQKEVGNITGITENTIRQLYRFMYTKGKDLFPECFTQLPAPEYVSALIMLEMSSDQ